MANWIEPIFDRTQADVDYAIAKISEWKSTGATNTTYRKGCMNISDLNRIETDIRYLSDELCALYYFPRVTTNTNWAESDLPNIKDIRRIIDNVVTIINSYCQSSDAPVLPDTMLSFEHVNSIEENLQLIKEILDNMKLSFRECDTFECGEE